MTSMIYKFTYLNSALEEVKDDLSEYTSASTFKRIILYVDLGSKIKACTVKLDFAMQLFQVILSPLVARLRRTRTVSK